jgi:hypothetical protein
MLAQNWTGLSEQLDIVTSGSTVSCLYNDGDSILYIGGKFIQTTTGAILSKIAKWNGQTLEPVGCGFNYDCENENDLSTWVGGVGSIIRFQGTLYASGSFTHSGANLLSNVAKWNGQDWVSVGEGFDGSVIRLAVIEDTLYACGVFTSSGTTELAGIAKWTGTEWVSVYDLPQYGNNPNSIADIALFQGKYYLSGNFGSIGAGINDLVYWNGNSWEEVGEGLEGGLMSVGNMEVLNEMLIISGSMSTDESSNNPGTGIIGWTGTEWFDFEGGTDDPSTGVIGMVFDMHIRNEKIYIAGNFHYAGGIPANQLAFWDQDHWCSYIDAFQIDGQQTNVKQTSFFEDTLYALGYFDGISGTENIIGIAKYLGGDTCEISPVVEQEVAVPILIYPNPTSDLLNIKSGEGHSELKIFDTLGQLLLTKNINTQSSIDVSQLKSGIYLLSIESENGKVVKRFVKD